MLFPLEQSVDSVCAEFALRFLEDLGQRKGAVIIGEGVEDESERGLALQRNRGACILSHRDADTLRRQFPAPSLRKMPSMVGCERAEDCFVILFENAEGFGDTRTFFASGQASTQFIAVSDGHWICDENDLRPSTTCEE